MMQTPNTDNERQITALLAEIPEEVVRIFTGYYQRRLARAQASAPIDPLLGATDPYACEADLIAQLTREADGRESPAGLGDVPVAGQLLSIPIPQSDPRKQAVPRGGGAGSTPTSQATQRQRLIQIVLVLAMLYPLGLLGKALFGWGGGNTTASSTTPTPAVVTPALTSAAPTPAPVRADVPSASDTAYWYPTSLELPFDPPAVLRVVAAPGTLGGNWQPQLTEDIAAWLEGTFVNTVLCLAPAHQPHLARLSAGQLITLRTANGGVRRYQLDTIRTVQRQQTEILTQRQARLTVLACATDGADRTVAQARFLTDASDTGSPTPTSSPVKEKGANP
jgi:hypothetical protein